MKDNKDLTLNITSSSMKDWITTPDIKKTKIKFNHNPNNTSLAYDLLIEDAPEWHNMIRWKAKNANNNYGHARYVIAMAKYYPLGNEYYVLGGIYKISDPTPDIWNEHAYQIELLPEYKTFYKRLVVKLDKPTGISYNRWYESIFTSNGLNPTIHSLLPEYSFTNLSAYFPGYNQINISFSNLKEIIINSNHSWKEALSNIKGIYLITDTNTGKHYVGSASSNDKGIWQRWESYINTLHGGNKTFIEIFNNDNNYIPKYFKFSILEIIDNKSSVDYIISRENKWKEILLTRKFGLNNN